MTLLHPLRLGATLALLSIPSPGVRGAAPAPAPIVNRIISTTRACKVVLLERSREGKSIALMGTSGKPLGSLDKPGSEVRIPFDGPAGQCAQPTFAFAGRGSTFGFRLRFEFEEGAYSYTCRVEGDDQDRFRVWEGVWKEGTARKEGDVKIDAAPGRTLLAFQLK